MAVVVTVQNLEDKTVAVLPLAADASFSLLRSTWGAQTGLDPDNFRFCRFGGDELLASGVLSDLLRAGEFALPVTAEALSLLRVSVLGVGRTLSVRVLHSAGDAAVRAEVARLLGVAGREMRLSRSDSGLSVDLAFSVSVSELPRREVWRRGKDRQRRSLPPWIGGVSQYVAVDSDSCSSSTASDSDSAASEEGWEASEETETFRFASEPLHRLLDADTPEEDQRLFLGGLQLPLHLSVGGAVALASPGLAERQHFLLHRRFSVFVRRGTRIDERRVFPSATVCSLAPAGLRLGWQGRPLSPEARLDEAGAAVDGAFLSPLFPVAVRTSHERHLLSLDTEATVSDLRRAVAALEVGDRFQLTLAGRELRGDDRRRLVDAGVHAWTEVTVRASGDAVQAVEEDVQTVGVGVEVRTRERGCQARVVAQERGVEARRESSADGERRKEAPQPRPASLPPADPPRPVEEDRREEEEPAPPAFHQQDVGRAWHPEKFVNLPARRLENLLRPPIPPNPLVLPPNPQPWPNAYPQAQPPRRAPPPPAIPLPAPAIPLPPPAIPLHPPAIPLHPPAIPLPTPPRPPQTGDFVTDAVHMAAKARRNAAQARKNAQETCDYWTAVRMENQDRHRQQQEKQREARRYGKAAAPAERNRAAANRQIEVDRQREAENFERTHRQKAGRVAREARPVGNAEEQNRGIWGWLGY